MRTNIKTYIGERELKTKKLNKKYSQIIKLSKPTIYLKK